MKDIIKALDKLDVYIYIYNHKYKDAVEITLHFIKELKFAYRHNANKLGRALVAYLWEEMWRLQASELSYNEARGPIYYLETMENPNPRRWSAKTMGPVWVNWCFNFLGT